MKLNYMISLMNKSYIITSLRVREREGSCLHLEDLLGGMIVKAL